MQQSSEKFKQAMSKFVTGIVVITTIDSKNQPIGITVNSFNSVSLNPPMVLFSIHRNSSLHSNFVITKNFVVNILSNNQIEESNIFAKPSKVDWHKIKFNLSQILSLPVLVKSLSYMECCVESVFDGGDHSIIIAKVKSSSTFNKSKPLIYYNRSYCEIGECLKK